MKIRIGLGAGLHQFDGADGFWRWVQLCEESGVDSLWQSDRLVSRVLGQPHFEALATIAAIAGATKRVQIGVNAIVAPHRDPLVMANQMATIDYLSKGRLIAVFGVGQAEDPEFRATGRDPKKRGRQADEVIELFIALIERDEVSFEGEFFRYDKASISPKPVRKPLPLWIGGQSEAAIKRTARFGNGWLGGLTTPEITADVVRKIKAASAELGRPADPDHFGVVMPYRFGSAEDPTIARQIANLKQHGGGAGLAVGGAPAILRAVRAFVDAGATKLVAVPFGAKTDAEFLAQTKALAEEVIPHAEAGDFTLAAA
jgi:probable F420-dependent oxidoreductase